MVAVAVVMDVEVGVGVEVEGISVMSVFNGGFSASLEGCCPPICPLNPLQSSVPASHAYSMNE